jgi:hypothetical protein
MDLNDEPLGGPYINLLYLFLNLTLIYPTFNLNFSLTLIYILVY